MLVRLCVRYIIDALIDDFDCHAGRCVPARFPNGSGDARPLHLGERPALRTEIRDEDQRCKRLQASCAISLNKGFSSASQEIYQIGGACTTPESQFITALLLVYAEQRKRLQVPAPQSALTCGEQSEAHRPWGGRCARMESGKN